MTATSEKTPDERTPRRFLPVAVSENGSDGRSFFSVSLSRFYRTGDGRRSTGSSGLNDLPHLAMVAQQAHQAVDDLPPDSRE